MRPFASLEVQSGDKAEQMIDLVKDTSGMEEDIEKMKMECELQITLLEYQVIERQ